VLLKIIKISSQILHVVKLFVCNCNIIHF
jgi:hypothetical protein